jgi:type II secretory pathway pseudopilin PulG
MRSKSFGFTIVELIVVVGMISIFSGLMLPSFLNWIRTEQVNSYTRELREYFRVVRLDARRWGSICNVNANSISHNSVPNDKNYYGYRVSCSGQSETINSLAPAINNSIFQVTNLDFRITPNGRISSDSSVVIVIGSKYFNSGAKLLNCLVIKSPTGHIVKGKFTDNEWISAQMPVSQIDQNNILTPNKCEAS